MSNARELAELSGSYGTGGFVGMKNRIINGDFRIDQRNAGASVSGGTTVVYPVDRFAMYGDVNSKFTGQRSTTVPSGFVNSTLITSSSAYSVGAGEVFALSQFIEGFNVADLGWGTANAATVTLSFWVRSSLTGTFGGAIQNGTNARSYPFSYTISAANTFEYKTVTIAGDTSGTWATDNSAGMVVRFGMGVGTTKSGTAGAWASADYRSATGATSVVGTSGATFYITGVQLEKGSTATSFDYRPYGNELALCQRYLPAVIAGGGGNEQIGSGMCVGASAGNISVPFLVTPRATPSGVTVSSASHYFVLNNGGNAVAVTSIALVFTGFANACITFATASGLATGNATQMFSQNAAAKLLFTGCEL
jgi:hypothetical protein